MGNYLHEKALDDAVKRLYMLGNRPASQHSSPGWDDMSRAVGAATKQFKLRKSASPPVQSAPPPEEIKQQAIVQNGKELERRLAAGELTKQMRVGGVYTPKGLQQAHETATVDADDLMRMRALIGQGMQLQGPGVQQQPLQSITGY